MSYRLWGRLWGFVLAFGISLGLAGCAFRDYHAERSQAVRDRMSGRPVTETIGYLGPPDSAITVSGKKYYSWKHDDGYTTSDSPPVYIPLSCKLAVTAGPDDIVERAVFLGNRGACAYFLDYLPG